MKGNRSLSNIRIPENAVKVTPLKKAPKKAISSVGDLAGEYEWTYYTTEEDPAVNTLVNETGISVCDLDPIISGPADPPLDYYEAVMLQNVKALLEAEN